jgi:GH24 family phage-related lysozyme (muramidase)
MQITVKTAMEIVSHEAIVREMYLDSVGVQTWSVGVTDATGHRVARYKDNPQTLERCLEVFIWALETRFAPGVRHAFDGLSLTEAQFAAALSFHYNTGGIQRAVWPKLWKDGNEEDAYVAFMNWSRPPEIIPRREKERDLFFEGKWTSDGMATEYQVSKPSYRPDWKSGKRVDIESVLKGLIVPAPPPDVPLAPADDWVTVTIPADAARDLKKALAGVK